MIDKYPDDQEKVTPLLAIILECEIEGKYLAYNDSCNWDTGGEATRCRSVKDILALANTMGGYLVFGVSKTSGWPNYGGLTSEQAATFRVDRINALLADYADPSILTIVRKLSHNGKMFVCVEVPRFTNGPHFCKAEYSNVLNKGEIYIRTNKNETTSLRSDSDLRHFIDPLVKLRRVPIAAPSEYLDQCYAEPTIAAVLDHSNYQSAGIYFDRKNPRSPFRDLDCLLLRRPSLDGVPAIVTLGGRLVFDGSDEHHVASSANNNPLGLCETSEHCSRSAPGDCYLCPKFALFPEGPHASLLAVLRTVLACVNNSSDAPGATVTNSAHRILDTVNEIVAIWLQLKRCSF
jgi:hypothetical protein